MKIPESIEVQDAIKSFITINNIWYFSDFVDLAIKEENVFIFKMSWKYPSYCLLLINERKRKIFNSKNKKENKNDNQGK
ncbi:hypothetical protein NX779_03080 [Mycoplasma cottewii]|uniref:Uncharacterized protein n=1 Tax=Mycoplasma cottewii TaxID=51364 RepID=A0ABY5TVT8_9MOLU|nr:hypothetical protein [Mycoplasma cottewii]UWD34774.1 hypothetical protein NX779_03080 [Mycoplasma cottewii]